MWGYWDTIAGYIARLLAGGGYAARGDIDAAARPSRLRGEGTCTNRNLDRSSKRSLAPARRRGQASEIGDERRITKLNSVEPIDVYSAIMQNTEYSGSRFFFQSEACMLFVGPGYIVYLFTCHIQRNKYQYQPTSTYPMYSASIITHPAHNYITTYASPLAVLVQLHNLFIFHGIEMPCLRGSMQVQGKCNSHATIYLGYENLN